MKRDFPPVLVLSLRRSAERRSLMLAVLGARGIEFRFVDAVDARDLPGGAPTPPGVTRGEWACLRTHEMAWRQVEGSSGPAVILEDDVLLRPASPAVIPLLPQVAGDSDLVLLGHHSVRRGPERGALLTFRSRALPEGHRLARLAEFTMGAYAYFLTPEGAAKLLSYSEPHRMPADWVTGYAPREGVVVRAVTPPCVVPHPTAPETTIDDRDPIGAGPEAHALLPASLRRRLPRWIPKAAGEAWLFLRRLGFAPSAYTWRAPRRSRSHQR